MKRKKINDDIRVNGYYVKEFSNGFFGEHGEGNKMLKRMGLQTEIIPFSTTVFLKENEARWKDKDGNTASISFRIKENQIECFGNYLGDKKSIRVFREWDDHEDKDTIARLESEAIGDLCMKCIYKIINV